MRVLQGNDAAAEARDGPRQQPTAALLDKPTSGLDVQSNLIIRDIITDLIREGVTIFLTTHNIEEANVTCDRVAIIDKGYIAAIDAPEQLKKPIQSVQSIEVSFDRSVPTQLDQLRQVPMVTEARKEGDKFKLYTEDPATVIDGVMAYARVHGTRVISVTTLGPSLEDAFIKLTGRSAHEVGCTPSTNRGGVCERLSSELFAAWAIAKKDIRIYYLKLPTIVFGMLFPLFMFLVFAVRRPAGPTVLIRG